MLYLLISQNILLIINVQASDCDCLGFTLTLRWVGRKAGIDEVAGIGDCEAAGSLSTVEI